MNRISFEFTGDVKQAIDAVKKGVPGAQSVQATDSQGRLYSEDGTVTENVPQNPDPATNPPTPQQGTATASTDPQAGKAASGTAGEANGATSRAKGPTATSGKASGSSNKPAGGKASR